MSLLGVDFSVETEGIIGTAKRMSKIERTELELKYKSLRPLRDCTGLELFEKYISLADKSIYYES